MSRVDVHAAITADQLQSQSAGLYLTVAAVCNGLIFLRRLSRCKPPPFWPVPTALVTGGYASQLVGVVARTPPSTSADWR